jgi:hypothetical protein
MKIHVILSILSIFFHTVCAQDNLFENIQKQFANWMPFFNNISGLTAVENLRAQSQFAQVRQDQASFKPGGSSRPASTSQGPDKTQCRFFASQVSNKDQSDWLWPPPEMDSAPRDVQPITRPRNGAGNESCNP